MEALRAQQAEALETAVPYCGKIIKAIRIVIEELSGNRQEDTDEYMNSIMEGLNWIFEVYNGTAGWINESGEVIDQAAVNGFVKMLNKANEDQDDQARAEAFGHILEFVEQFQKEAEKKVAQAIG